MSRNLISLVLLLIALTLTCTSCLRAPRNFCTIRCEKAEEDLDCIEETEMPPEHPMTLEEVIEFALEHNLDIKAQRWQEWAQCEKRREEWLQTLPSLTLNPYWSERNNLLVSSSQSVTNQPPAPPSISTQRQTKTFDATLMWGVLDFGLSYYQSRQEGNRAHLLMQKHLRDRQNLVLDIYKAYYRAAVNKQMLDRARQILAYFKTRAEALQRQEEDRIVSEWVALAHEDRMIDAEIKLYAYENEYRAGLVELMALMGLPPCRTIELAPLELLDFDEPPFDVCELEQQALCSRPELFQQDRQFDVDCDEVRASILRMFPNAQVFGSYNYDGNKFLMHNDWMTVGIKAAWDLLHLPARSHGLYRSKFAAQFTKDMRISMSVAIMSQVHIAHFNVHDSLEQYRLARQAHQVKQRLLDVAVMIEEAGEFNHDEVLGRQVDAIFAELGAFKAYANVSISLEQLANSIGKPLLFLQPGWYEICMLNEHCME